MELLQFFNESIPSQNNFIVTNYPYLNIYDKASYTEFCLYSKNKISIRIECKNQDKSGSVLEKFPFLFDSIRTENDFLVIILSGEQLLQNKNSIERAAFNKSINPRQLKLIFVDNLTLETQQTVSKELLSFISQTWGNN